MPLHLPGPLSRLNGAVDATARETAWGDFVSAYSDVVLRTCRSVAREYDVAMDAYAFVLQSLGEDNHRRLRAYVPDGKTRFETWLLVVTRRLALDHIRHRYGRSRTSDETRRAEHVARRRLEDLVATEIEPDHLPSASLEHPDAGIRREELREALRAALRDLASDDRLLLVLRFQDERPVRDIARALRLPSVFHVYRRLTTVLTTLRGKLRDRGVDEAEP